MSIIHIFCLLCYNLFMIALLFLLAIPIACVSWTVTHEEIFREPRDWCKARIKKATSIFGRKIWYPFTCEYCFSHYVTILVLIMTKYYLIFPDWRGYVIAGFSLVWIANIYMSIFQHLRLNIKLEELERDEMNGK